MAHLLLHGTLDATILEADNLANPTRATGGAPGIFRKVKNRPPKSNLCFSFQSAAG